jgi:hypothetical protein
MALGLLESAANVRQAKAELDDICKQLRHDGKEWCGVSIAAEDAMKIADDGLRNCWVMLDRIKQIALAERARHTA